MVGPPSLSVPMGFQATVNWVSVVLGALFLAQTAFLLIVGRCGKRLTHMRPIYVRSP